MSGETQIMSAGATQMIAALVEQSAGPAGLGGLNAATLGALIEHASEAGAARALDRLGLSDGDAGDDIRELRQLLSAWRDAKRSAWKAAVDCLVRGVLAALLIVIAVKTGFGSYLR